MPGEISRSNPGPRGKTPLIPSWIEEINRRMAAGCLCRAKDGDWPLCTKHKPT